MSIKINRKQRSYEPTNAKARQHESLLDSTYGKDKRYQSALWVAIRLEVLSLQPLCRDCEAQGMITVATVADHIKPVTSGGEFYDMNNLQGLCTSCHARKSSLEGWDKKRNK